LGAAFKYRAKCIKLFGNIGDDLASDDCLIVTMIWGNQHLCVAQM
jgi:hypothetical protein